MMREYRAVQCDTCLWQDYYETGRRPSYPPRCPECGTSCTQGFFVSSFSPNERARLGHDRGTRFAFGDPRPYYKNLRDRMSNRAVSARLQ